MLPPLSVPPVMKVLPPLSVSVVVAVAVASVVAVVPRQVPEMPVDTLGDAQSGASGPRRHQELETGEQGFGV